MAEQPVDNEPSEPGSSATNTAQPAAPRHPRDWRFWVGGTGRVLLIIGVLMFGFLAYQLWGTGIEYRQSQDSLEKEFEQRAATIGTDAVVDTITEESLPISETYPTTAEPTDSIIPTTVATATPDSSGTTSATATTKPRARPKRWPLLEKGDALAIIEIPRLHKRVYAVAGVAANDLKRGLGHYPGTPLPGQFGNSAFAGHRTTYGAPLFNIDKLRVGDKIIVRTLLREQFVYLVTAAPRVISSQDGSVIVTTDPSVATLTLTSCHPKYSAKQRIVVSAVLDPEQSGIVQEPTPEVDPPAPSDNPAKVDPNNPVEPGTSDPAVATVPDSSSATQTTVDAEPASTDTGGALPGDATDPPDGSGTAPETASVVGADGLAHGWFDDKGAWWHVAGWSLLELALVAGAWLLARRTKRRWLGFVVAAAPFLVVLYFVYQNINRLLPADL